MHICIFVYMHVLHFVHLSKFASLVPMSELMFVCTYIMYIDIRGNLYIYILSVQLKLNKRLLRSVNVKSLSQGSDGIHFSDRRSAKKGNNGSRRLGRI